MGDDLVDLFLDSDKLLTRAMKAIETGHKQSGFFSYDDGISDYSYIVLPAAKAYEGILKKILVKTGLVTESVLLEKPELSLNSFFNPIANESIFAALKDKARDKAVPHIIYATYQECRNEILHYDPYRDNRLSLRDAAFYISRIDDAVEKAYITFKAKI